jgi:hypothetical protein
MLPGCISPQSFTQAPLAKALAFGHNEPIRLNGLFNRESSEGDDFANRI